MSKDKKKQDRARRKKERRRNKRNKAKVASQKRPQAGETWFQEEVVSFECPCGKQVTITQDPSGVQPSSILHELPMCAEYEQLAPDDYLRWVRGKREGRLDA